MDPCTVVSGIVTGVAIPTVAALWHALQSERAAHRETLMQQQAEDRKRIEMLERLTYRQPDERR